MNPRPRLRSLATAATPALAIAALATAACASSPGPVAAPLGSAAPVAKETPDTPGIREKRRAPKKEPDWVAARSALKNIGRGMVAGWEREDVGGIGGAALHRMCPNAGPIPKSVAELVDGPRQVRDTDFNADRGWSCMKFSLSGELSYQLEVVSRDEGFTAYARARGTDGRVREISLSGKLAGPKPQGADDRMLTLDRGVVERTLDE